MNKNVKSNVKKNIKKGKTIHRKPNKNLYIFLGIIVILVVAILIIINLTNKNKYEYAENRMNWYGYNLLYDNESAAYNEDVKSDEIVKIILGVIYNRTDEDFAFNKMKDALGHRLSFNEAWVRYAEFKGISEASHIEFSKEATLKDTVIFAIAAIEKIYGVNITVEDTLDSNIQDGLSKEEIELLNKAISIGLIEHDTKIKDVTINKGELNNIAIRLAEKYSTMVYSNLVQGDKKVSIVTEEDKLPKNANIYPYVLSNAEKGIYEIETSKQKTTISETPKQVYDIYHDQYNNSANNINNFLNAILNVDYRTITVDSMIESIQQYVSYDIDKEQIKEYVDYVKENEIILKGNANALLPIIYSDGLLHYARTKINVEIVNSKTNKNILLWDSGVNYKGKNIEVYTDVAVTPTIYSNAFRIYNGMSCMSNIVQNDGNVEVSK